MPFTGLVEDLEGPHAAGHGDTFIEKCGSKEQAVTGGKLAQFEFLHIRFVLDVEHDRHEGQEGVLRLHVRDVVRVKHHRLSETIRQVEKGLNN